MSTELERARLNEARDGLTANRLATFGTFVHYRDEFERLVREDERRKVEAECLPYMTGKIVRNL